MNTLKNFSFATLPALFILLIVLEVFFRIVIPADDPPESFFDENEKMYYFSNRKERGLSTRGRFAEIKAKWRINNMNWNYPVDYSPIDDKKLISVIGDSYIEAFQVDVDKNYPYLLREKLKSDYEVFAFGISGAPLSQYLNISRYINKHFDPDIIIINLVYNDFDESIQELFPNDYHFLKLSIDKDSSILETTPRPNHAFLQYRPFKRLIFKSALFRYLYLNLHIKEFRHKFMSSTKDNFEANINVDNFNRNRKLILKATDYLVNTIREENRDKRVIFIFDAPRENIYYNTLDKSNILWMNEMMGNICKNNNIEYIDLTPLMLQDYRTNSTKFNSEIDGHWNEYGHRFVANKLYDYLNNTKK